jgi:hypothetical protein
MLNLLLQPVLAPLTRCSMLSAFGAPRLILLSRTGGAAGCRCLSLSASRDRRILRCKCIFESISARNSSVG